MKNENNLLKTFISFSITECHRKKHEFNLYNIIHNTVNVLVMYEYNCALRR